MSVDPRTGATLARQRATPGQALELSREAVELAGILGSQVVELHQVRSSRGTTDGYRRSTRLDGARPGRGGHADPVADVVVREVDAANEGRGPARRAYAEAVDTLEATVVLLRSAVHAATAVLEPTPIPGPEDRGCTSHAAHGYLGVETRTPGSDLCRWCSDFWRKYRQRPSANDLASLEERRVHTEQTRRAA